MRCWRRPSRARAATSARPCASSRSVGSSSRGPNATTSGTRSCARASLREMLHSEQTAAHRAAVQGLRLSAVDGSPAGAPAAGPPPRGGGRVRRRPSDGHGRGRPRAQRLRLCRGAPPAGRGTRAALEPRRRPGGAQRAVRRGPGLSRGRDGTVGGSALGSGHPAARRPGDGCAHGAGPRAAGARAGRGAVGRWGSGSSAGGL